MTNIKSIKPIGKHQTYDLEVNHKDHQFYLSNGVLTSNSHACLYSMMSFETAYLKAHYPLEFLTANLISEVSSNAKASKDNILRIKNEMRNNGIKIIPPKVNLSSEGFKIIDDKTLMTGLDALKYMGKDAIPELLEKRPFKSFRDMMYRIDSSKVRSQTIQALAGCGALDDFEDASRQQMFQYASDYRNKLRLHIKKLHSKYNRELKKAEKNGSDYPLPVTQEDELKHLETFEYKFPALKKWTIREKFAIEEYYLGEGISGSIYERYDGFLRSKVTKFADLPKLMPFRDLEDEDIDERTLRKANTHNIFKYGLSGLKGVLVSVWSFIVKKEKSAIFGQEMARLTVQDPYGNLLDIIAFPEAWNNMQERIKKLSSGKTEIEPGIALYFSGMFQWENNHTYSFILADILSYKDKPKTPKDFRKALKVKSERKKDVTVEDIKELSKEDLAEKLEEEAIESGDYLDEEDEFEDDYDPFS